MTLAEKEKLEQELEELKLVRRPEVVGTDQDRSFIW